MSGDWSLLIGNGFLSMNNMAILTGSKSHGSFDWQQGTFEWR